MTAHTKDAYYKVGFIKRPHGLKGEVTVIPDTTLPIDWELLENIMVEMKGRLVPYFIEDISLRPDKLFIKFEDTDTPEDASLLQGCSLYLLKDSRAELEAGDFYDDEIIGFEVIDKVLGKIGMVKDIEQAGSNRFLLVDYQGKEAMIPAHEPLIISIDKKSKVISTNLPDGLLEL